MSRRASINKAAELKSSGRKMVARRASIANLKKTIDTFVPKRSKHVPKPLQEIAGQSDEDTWKEYFAISRMDEFFQKGKAGTPKVRSYFMNSKGAKVWDEPPSGASNIKFASIKERKKAEAKAASIAEEHEHGKRSKKPAKNYSEKSEILTDPENSDQGNISKLVAPTPSSRHTDSAARVVPNGTGVGGRRVGRTKSVLGPAGNTIGEAARTGNKPRTKATRGPQGNTLVNPNHVKRSTPPANQTTQRPGQAEMRPGLGPRTQSTLRQKSNAPVGVNLSSGKRKIMIQHNGPLSRKDEDTLMKMITAINIQEQAKAKAGNYNPADLPPLVFKLEPDKLSKNPFTKMMNRNKKKDQGESGTLREGDFIQL